MQVASHAWAQEECKVEVVGKATRVYSVTGRRRGRRELAGPGTRAAGTLRVDGRPGTRQGPGRRSDESGAIVSADPEFLTDSPGLVVSACFACCELQFCCTKAPPLRSRTAPLQLPTPATPAELKFALSVL